MQGCSVSKRMQRFNKIKRLLAIVKGSGTKPTNAVVGKGEKKNDPLPPLSLRQQLDCIISCWFAMETQRRVERRCGIRKPTLKCGVPCRREREGTHGLRLSARVVQLVAIRMLSLARTRRRKRTLTAHTVVSH